MVGLVVAAHGRLADELLAAAEQIVGKVPASCACSIQPGDSPERIKEAVQSAVGSVDAGEGVIVLADLFGGTPANQALALLGRRRLEVLTGVNLPMLLKASSLREQPMSLLELAEALVQYGKRNITSASAMLREATARP